MADSLVPASGLLSSTLHVGSEEEVQAVGDKGRTSAAMFHTDEIFIVFFFFLPRPVHNV